MELTDKKIEDIIRDVAYQINQSTKSENSGLMSDIKGSILVLKEQHKEVIDRLVRIESQLDKEREISDKKYAIKLAEILIFGLCSVILLGTIGAIFKLIIA